MNSFYDYKMHVGAQEIDMFGRLKLSSFMFHTQQAAGEHVEQFGYSYLFLREQDYVYLLLRYELNIYRLPFSGENITMRTYHTGAKGALFNRYHLIYDENNILIAESASGWPVIRFSQRKIIKPSLFPYIIPQNNNLSCSISEASKVATPNNLESCYTRRIGFSQIDVNGHLNNSRYADMIVDAIPTFIEGKIIKSFAINFIKEASFGDVLEILISNDENIWFISGRTGQDKCFDARVVTD